MPSTTFKLLCCCFALAALVAAQGVQGGSVPTECAALLQATQTTTLQSSSCSAAAFSKAVADVYVYSAEFVGRAMEEVARIGLHFSHCAVELVPVSVMRCVVSGLVELPAEVQTLVTDTVHYLANILTVVQDIVGDIESCFNATALADLSLKAKACQTRLAN